VTLSPYFDSLETRRPEQREHELLSQLPAQVAHAKAKAPYWTGLLADVAPEAIDSRGALAGLPVTRKSELAALQAKAPPLGGLAAIQPGHAGRVFSSPGAIFELEGIASDYGRFARAFFAAGVRPGELVVNAFSYHLTPGGWMMDAGVRALGAVPIPAGTGQSEQQAAAIAHLRPAGWSGTPDFLKVVLEKGDELKLDLTSITKALVSGGALFPALRQAYAARGIRTLQCYATAELGLVAYESAAADGSPNPGLIVDEKILVEVVRPGTGDPVPEGEVGEVVVTNLNPVLPLIRFATGDLSAVLPGTSPCGRTGPRIRGWMGRADQVTKVKGMFVHPAQVAEVLKRHPEVAKARLEVRREGDQDIMILHCEAANSPESLAKGLADSLQNITKLKGEVLLVTPGSLPNDGKVIDDQRRYDA
jgi:phenylacetate-CoA ligase